MALQKISVSEAAFPTGVLERAGYFGAAFGPTDRTDFGVAVLRGRELPKEAAPVVVDLDGLTV